MKKAKYSHREPVYLVVDPEVQWIITGIMVGMGDIQYRISNGYSEKMVYECEITDEAIVPVKIKGLK